MAIFALFTLEMAGVYIFHFAPSPGGGGENMSNWLVGGKI